MAEFVTNLWEAVFTPGTTPTLLLATNATFACLQVLLAVLLAFTFSIHFLILSILSGGLWWSINWFADEVRQAQETEAKAEELRRRKAEEDKRDEDGSGADDERDVVGAETETETEELSSSRSKQAATTEKVEFRETAEDAELRGSIIDSIKKQGHATEGARDTDHAQATALQLQPPADVTRRAGKSGSDASVGDVSTDSEWEKIESEER